MLTVKCFFLKGGKSFAEFLLDDEKKRTKRVYNRATKIITKNTTRLSTSITNPDLSKNYYSPQTIVPTVNQKRGTEAENRHQVNVDPPMSDIGRPTLLILQWSL
jgi:hypothetical protein